MPYDRGKRSVELGQLQVRHLNSGVVSVQSGAQLPPGPAPGPHVAPSKQGWGRRVFNLRQVQAMVKVVREREFDLDLDPSNPWAAPDRVSGPEFAFHGTPVTWDAIYEDGGLKSVGLNTHIGNHVFNSNLHASAYVSGTRSLAIAHSFAKKYLNPALGEYGFVYLFHVEGGIVISPHHGHNQAEIAGLGMVPIRDILMFKWLAQPRTIYVNLEYKATALTAPTIHQGLLMIGGGATP